MSYIYDVDILDEAKDNFLTYASEVLTDRAIPAAEDGLLSSQRRLLWTMEDYLKMDSKGKTKKCNAIVGSTLATSYFHGDQSCYGVLCKMSQEYLMRYPLVAGQGSLGTQENNDMVASSRYTEGKPSIYTDLMMNDFKKDVVPLKETYNGEFMEPVVLPSLFPNAICNGRQAIGVSMAHNSAPHNLTECCNAAIAFINNPSMTVEELLEIMPGPDFPLGGRVLNKKDIKAAFANGKSNISLKIQGDYTIDGQKIIFTTIPYRTYRNKIKEQLEKNIEVFEEILDDYDDASNVGQNKLIFYVKPGVSVSKALNKLFLLTDLQTTLSYNMNYIVNGTPKLCSMLDLISAYVKHQENILVKATEFDKAKAEARAHILRGLIAAVDAIDQVIELIKASSDKASARAALIKLLAIDEVQANAILDMKLGRLTKVDKQELVDELKEKEVFIAQCVEILTNQEKRNGVLIQRIASLRDTYGDARRTQLLDIDVPKQEKEVVVKDPTDCVVVVTKRGMVKRIDKKSFKVSKRAAAGTKLVDTPIYSCSTNTEDTLLIFSNLGKMYRIVVDNLPEGTNASTGSALSGLVEFGDGEYPMAFTCMDKDAPNRFLFFATKNGIVKKVSTEEYIKTKKSGIIAITLRENDSLAAITFIDKEDMILVTEKGMAIHFATNGMPISSRTAQGVKGINLNDGDNVIAAVPLNKPNGELVLVSRDGQGKRLVTSLIPSQGRAGKGVIVYKGELGGATLAAADDSIIVNGTRTAIVVAASDFPSLTRVATGNIIMKNDTVTSISVN